MRLVPLLLAVLPASALALKAPQLPKDAVLGDPLPASTPAQLGISLRVRDQAGLDRLLADLQDVQSPVFHRWITPQEFGARFGQTEADYERVAHWLESAGFQVTRWPNRSYLTATGTVGGVHELLQVVPHSVTQSGWVARTFLGSPSLPADIEGRVVAIGGLDTRRRWHHHIPDMNSGSGFAFGPQDYRAFYDFAGLASTFSASGKAQLAVIATQVPDGGAPDGGGGADLPSLADINAYYALGGASVSPNLITLPNANADFDTLPNANIEFELDAEMQSVGSPDATQINVVLAPSSQVFGDATNYIVNELSTVVAASASLGECEPDFAGDDLSPFDALFQQGLAEGISWFVASGDSGANGCEYDGVGGGNLAVEWPCSSPRVVCVGGTQLTNAPLWDVNGNLDSYQAESTWNEGTICGMTGCEGAGGGGVSTLYAKPSWQQGVTPTDGQRDVPDISFLAAASTPGTAIYEDTFGPTALGTVGGTSVAAPVAAGIFALVSSALGCRLGDLHPALYQLGAVQADAGAASPFNDITVGNNSYGPVTGYGAGPGFDLATGWGSIDVAALTTVLSCPPPTTSSSSGTTGGTTGSATTGSSSGTYGSCSPSTTTVNNGDLGMSCTGAAAQGSPAVQGSCIVSGELCLDIFGDSIARCFSPCANGTLRCPDTAICVAVQLSSGVSDLCLPDCQPSLGGCPTGLACYPLTPNPDEAGFCFAPCQSSSLCNQSSATHISCVSGTCHCTEPGDCPNGQTCDVTSGVCYRACAGSCTGDGCCATVGTLEYCDAEGVLPANSATTSGSTGGGVTTTGGTVGATAVTTSAGSTGGGVATTVSSTAVGTTSGAAVAAAGTTGHASTASGSSASTAGATTAGAGTAIGSTSGASTAAGSPVTGTAGTAGGGTNGASTTTGGTTFAVTGGSSLGCSCKTGSATGSLLPLLGLALLRRRRYQRRA